MLENVRNTFRPLWQNNSRKGVLGTTVFANLVGPREHITSMKWNLHKTSALLSGLSNCLLQAFNSTI